MYSKTNVSRKIKMTNNLLRNEYSNNTRRHFVYFVLFFSFVHASRFYSGERESKQPCIRQAANDLRTRLNPHIFIKQVDINHSNHPILCENQTTPLHQEGGDLMIV